MVTRVLVPMDDSTLSREALEYALETHPDAEITVLHVTGEPSPMMGEAMSIMLEEDSEQAAREQAEGVFDTARDIAARHDAEVGTAVAWGNPAKQILDRADGFDTVVIGGHDSSLVDRLLVGNIAEKVSRKSSVPVTVVR